MNLNTKSNLPQKRSLLSMGLGIFLQTKLLHVGLNYSLVGVWFLSVVLSVEIGCLFWILSIHPETHLPKVGHKQVTLSGLLAMLKKQKQIV